MSVEELETILLAKLDNQDRIVKAGLAYFHQTHKPDMIARPDLFKLNKISSEEWLENLMILLSDRDNSTGTVVDLPTNADVLQMITRDVTHKPTKDATTLLPDINDLCIVVWAVDGRMYWFLGYIKKQDDGHYLVDHLERESGGNDYVWKYPLTDDVHKAETDQIDPVKVLWDWNVTRDTCQMRICVKNAADIAKKFQFPWWAMIYVVVIFWWGTVNHKMGIFNLSESEMWVLTIICICNVFMSNGFLVEKI